MCCVIHNLLCMVRLRLFASRLRPAEHFSCSCLLCWAQAEATSLSLTMHRRLRLRKHIRSQRTSAASPPLPSYTVPDGRQGQLSVGCLVGAGATLGQGHAIKAHNCGRQAGRQGSVRASQVSGGAQLKQADKDLQVQASNKTLRQQSHITVCLAGQGMLMYESDWPTEG